MCEHKRLTYVSKKGETRVFCADCGKELDKTLTKGENSANKPPVDAGMDKAPAKRTRAKKPV